MNYIPTTFYVGFRSYNDDVLLGFMTPDTGDASFKGRKDTVDKWANRDKSLPSITVDNKLCTGYSIVDNVSRYSTSNVVWRILHPRGFQIEITSGNLMHLIQECAISEGEFMKELIWVRIGSDNYLTYSGSSIYDEAITQEQMLTSVKTTDVQYGDCVQLKDGTIGVYYGTAHFIEYVYPNYYDTDANDNFLFKDASRKRHCIGIQNPRGGERISAISALKINKIVTPAVKPLTKDEAYKIVQNKFNTDSTKGMENIHLSTQISNNRIVVSKSKFQYNIVTTAEFKKRMCEAEKFVGGVIAASGEIFMEISPRSYNANPNNVHLKQVTESSGKFIKSRTKNSSFNMFNKHAYPNYEFDLDDTSLKFFILEIVKK